MEAAITVGIDGADQITTAATGCATHSGVLGMKPIYGRLGNMPGKLVKLANLLESGRTASKFLHAQ